MQLKNQAEELRKTIMTTTIQHANPLLNAIQNESQSARRTTKKNAIQNASQSAS